MNMQSLAALVTLGGLFVVAFLGFNLLLLARHTFSSDPRIRSTPFLSTFPKALQFAFIGAWCGFPVGCGLAAMVGGSPEYGMFGLLLGPPVGAFLGLILGILADGLSIDTLKSTAEPPPLPEAIAGKQNDPGTDQTIQSSNAVGAIGKLPRKYTTPDTAIPLGQNSSTKSIIVGGLIGLFLGYAIIVLIGIVTDNFLPPVSQWPQAYQDLGLPVALGLLIVGPILGAIVGLNVKTEHDRSRTTRKGR